MCVCVLMNAHAYAYAYTCNIYIYNIYTRFTVTGKDWGYPGWWCQLIPYFHDVRP